MSHAPPVPAGNQSPYPIAEPPHVNHAVRKATASDDAGKQSGNAVSISVAPRTVGLAAVAAVVTAGAIAGLIYALTGKDRNPRKPEPAKRNRRKSSAKRR